MFQHDEVFLKSRTLKQDKTLVTSTAFGEGWMLGAAYFSVLNCFEQLAGLIARWYHLHVAELLSASPLIYTYSSYA